MKNVFIDGATLSALLFNTLNSSGCENGFLFGERVDQIEDKISDSQIHSSDTSSFLYVTSFVPWPSLEFICGRSGCLKEDAIAKLMPSKEQDLIGWYSFRHQTSLRPSLKEATLHNKLASCPAYHGDAADLCLLLCSSTAQLRGATHTCSHGFMHLVKGLFKMIPMSVQNLGDTTRKEYRKRSNATLSHSQSIHKMLQNQKKNFVNKSEQVDHAVKVDGLAKSVNTSLQSIYTKVSQSESVLGLLEIDVRNLKSQLEVLEQQELRLILEEKEETAEHSARETSFENEDSATSIEEKDFNAMVQELQISEKSSVSRHNHDAEPDAPQLPSINFSPDILCPETTNKLEISPEGLDHSEPLLSSRGGKRQGSDDISKTTSKCRVLRKNDCDIKIKSKEVDPFASLGDVCKLEKDLKLSNPKNGQSSRSSQNNKKGVNGKDKDINAHDSVDRQTHRSTRSKLDTSNKTNNVNGDSEPEQEDNESLGDNSNSMQDNLLSEMVQTVPSSSPLF